MLGDSMATTTTSSVHRTTPPVRTEPAGGAHLADRATAALLLLVVAGTHLVLVPEHLDEAPYVGHLFLALAAVCTVLAGLLLLRDHLLVWAVTGGVAAASLVAYLASRTVGLPRIGDDVGNWTDPWSFPSVTAEALLVVVAVSECVRRRSRAR
jgi:hypothetical protein